jgi:CheY-like chemotaxis protein
VAGRVLVADSDARSLRILELAFGKAGIAAQGAGDAAEARKLLPGSSLLVCDAALDGIALCTEAKTAGLPVVLLASDKTLHAKAVEAGADEFLHKPVLLKELVQRVHFLLDRRHEPHEAGLTGAIQDMGLLDVFHSLAGWRKSALVRCEQHGHEARVWVKDGEVIDAELGPLRGDPAFYRLLTWDSGQYGVQFGEVDREVRIAAGTHGALLEAMRRVDELSRVAQELPMTAMLEVDYGKLLGKLATLPDEMSGVVRGFDGKRTLREAIDLSPLDDLTTVAVVQRLRGEGILTLAPGLAQPLVRRAAPSLPPPPPLDLIRYSPLRGARRERLRREADEMRARVAAGKPVRLTRAVELPAWQGSGPAEGRMVSPAVGEAARRFAPDTESGRPELPPAIPLQQRIDSPPRVELPPRPTPARGSPAVQPQGGPAAIRQGVPVAVQQSVPVDPEVALGSPQDKLSARPPPVSPVPKPPEPVTPGVAGPRLYTPMPDIIRVRPAPQKTSRPVWPWVVAAGFAAAAATLWLTRPEPVTARKDAGWLAKQPAPAGLQAAPGAPQAAPVVPAPVSEAAAAEDPAVVHGEELLERGQYREAIAELKLAVSKRPQSVSAQLALGNAYLEADQPKSAINPLQTASELDGTNPRAQLLLGTAWQSLGKNTEAAKAYRRYLELDPGGDYAHDVRLILENLLHSG